MRRLTRELLQDTVARFGRQRTDPMAVPSYLHPNPLVRWMAWRRVEAVAGRARALASRLPGPMTVLEFGCGVGVQLETLVSTGATVFATDLDLGPARHVVERLRLENVHLLGPQDVPRELGDASVDLVIAAEVLEHLDRLQEPLDMFRRVLKPDGELLVSLPTENSLYRLGRRVAGFSGAYHHHGAAFVHRSIVGHGFTENHHSTIPLPGAAALYWVVGYGLTGSTLDASQRDQGVS